LAAIHLPRSSIAKRVPLTKHESLIQRKVLWALKKRYPNGLFRKASATVFGLSGTSDILFWIDEPKSSGGIELKTPDAYALGDHDLSPSQIYFARLMLRAGGTWGVADCVARAVEIVERGQDPAYREQVYEQLRLCEKAQELGRAERRNKKKAEKHEAFLKRKARRFKKGKVPIPIGLLKGLYFLDPDVNPTIEP